MTVFLSDRVEEASTTALSAHTPNIGGAWTADASIEIAAGTGEAYFPAAGVLTAENAATPGDAAQTMTFVCQAGGVGNCIASFWLRKTPGVFTGYRATFHASAGMSITKVVAGAETELVSNPSPGLASNEPFSGSFSISAAGVMSFVVASEATIGVTNTDIAGPGVSAVGGRDLVLKDVIAEDGTASGPVITGPSGTGGTLTGSGSCSTTGTNGNLWWKVDATSTASDPGAGSESGAGWTSQTVSGSGTQTVASFGALTAGTKYAHYLHVDGSSNRSTVADSSSFTVTAGANKAQHGRTRRMMGA